MNMNLHDTLDMMVSDPEDTKVYASAKEMIHNIIHNEHGKNINLNILHLNIRSLQKNYDELLIFIYDLKERNVDVIILTETFILEDMKFYEIPGYSAFYNNAKFNTHDGVVCYIKDTINATAEIHKLSEITILRIVFEYNGIKHGLTAFYRLPSASASVFLADFGKYLKELEKQTIEIFAGDVNFDLLDKNNKTVNEYLSITDINGYISYINLPTRVTQDTGSCIDHFFVRNVCCEGNLKFIGSIIENTITDHYAIFLTVQYQGEPVRDRLDKAKTIPKVDLEKLNGLLSHESWCDVLSSSDSNSATNYFIEKFNNCLSQSTKQITFKNIKKLKPWITTGLVTSIGIRDKLKKKLLKNKNNELQKIEEYKEYRNCLSKLLKKVKNDYFKRKLENCNNNYKLTWKIINEASGNKACKQNNINKILIDGINESDNYKIAQTFNNYFTNIGLDMAKKIKNPQVYVNKYESNQQSSMFLPPIQGKDIITLISKLKSSSAPGLDGVTAGIIKYVHLNIIEPLKHIINLIISSGEIPPHFKTSVISPIHKAGNKNEVQNYRPISQLNCFAKILEMYMKNCLMSFLETNNVISHKQYGFMKGFNTEGAINKLVGDVLDGFNGNKCTIAVFLDLAKAFDTIPHDKLLKKLESIGIRGMVLRLFQNYLRNRTQYVKINGVLSAPRTVEIGIPQGTVLGPILFLLYINDLYQITDTCNIISYADDTVILGSGDNWLDTKLIIEKCLGDVKKWLDLNMLTLNIKKTKCITFSVTRSKQPLFDKINLTSTETIECVSEIKYLGVMLDQHLRWDVHALFIAGKLRKAIHIFYILRNILTKHFLGMVYTSLIESILRYGIIVWGSLLPSNAHSLQTVQNSLVKIMLGLNRLFPTDDLYQKNKILNIKALYVHTLLCWMHKNKHKNVTITHRYMTRGNVNEHVARNKYSKSICQRQSNFYGSKYYNILPHHLKTIKNFKKFSASVKNFILENLWRFADT